MVFSTSRVPVNPCFKEIMRRLAEDGLVLYKVSAEAQVCSDIYTSEGTNSSHSSWLPSRFHFHCSCFIGGLKLQRATISLLTTSNTRAFSSRRSNQSFRTASTDTAPFLLGNAISSLLQYSTGCSKRSVSIGSIECYKRA